MSKLLNNLINHVVFVLDASGSMGSLRDSVVSVVDNQVKFLAKRSQELDQETRVSIYVFNTVAECVVYDKDVLRLPSIAKFYNPGGGTALIDASLLALDDLAKTATLYGDHSFLAFCVSDGENNSGTRDGNILKNKIAKLPDSWTLAALVPNASAVHEAKQCGFSSNNIQIWDTNSKDFNEVGKVINKSIDSYLVARSTGVRSTKNLFSIDQNALTTTVIKNTLAPLAAGKDYDVYPVRSDKDVIKPFVESWTQEGYRLGSAYYQLTKPEKIQASKNILIQDKLSGRVYSGADARQTLGLPNYEVKVNAVDHPKYNIYVQSSSVNRKLVRDTKVIVIK